MTDLYRLANIVGLDTTNAQHSVALQEAMHGIKDPEAFLDYCRDHKEGITTYGKNEKPERLDTLASRYKRLQDQAELPTDQAELSAQKLCDMFDKVRLILKNALDEGRAPKLKNIKADDHQYFTDAQAEALEKIGSLAYVIDLCETGELKDRLIDLYLEKYIKKSKYSSLTEGQRKVKALIGSIK